MELKFTKDAVQALKYNPAGPETQQVWEEGGTNLGISLSLRGKHQWIARVYVRQPGGSHKKRIGRLFWNASIRQKSLDDARREKMIWDGEAAQGIDPIEKRRPSRARVAASERPSGPATVAMLLDTYMAEYVAKELEPGTYDRYTKLIRHIDRHLGTVPVPELDKAKMNALKREMADIRESFNKARKLISGAYRTADGRDWTHGGGPLVPPGLNPALFVGPYDTAASRKAGDPFESEEETALITTAGTLLRQNGRGRYPSRGRTTVALAVFLLYTGMRKNEGMGLSWTNLNLPKGKAGWSGWIDFKRGVVQLIHHKTSRRKGPRVVPLSSQALQVLELMVGQDETWVFPGSTPGQRLVQEFYGWRRLLKEAKVRPRGIHQTRHTFITRALEAGAPIGAVAKAVGHTTVYITEIYGHISDRAARSAAELVGNHMHQLDYKFLNDKADVEPVAQD